MGTFKYNHFDLSKFVYGYGTSNEYEGFTTVQVTDKYKISGTPIRAVPRDANTMPFSDLDNLNYKDNSIPIFGEFAEVGRFIRSVESYKINLLASQSDLTPNIKRNVYYTGSGNDIARNDYSGVIAVGSPTDIRKSGVPSVILVVVQAKGGNGGTGDRKGNTIVGGGGGGSGAFVCFQIALPYTLTTPTVVFKYELTYNSVIIYDPFDNMIFTLYNGSNGTNGTINSAGIPTQGRGGNGGTGSPGGSQRPNNWSLVNNIVPGVSGGNGGYYYSGTSSDVLFGTYGTGLNTKSVLINTCTQDSHSKITGFVGGSPIRVSVPGAGADRGEYGGGGAGSMLGVGGGDNSGIGAGGRGGTGYVGGVLDAKSGGGAAIYIYW